MKYLQIYAHRFSSLLAVFVVLSTDANIISVVKW